MVSLEQQAEVALRWRASCSLSAAAPGAFKPFLQSLYVHLTDDPDGSPEPIHLGFRAGRNFLFRYLDGLRERQGYTTSGSNFKYGLWVWPRISRRSAGRIPAPHRRHRTDRRGRDAQTIEEPGEPADAERP